MKRNNFLPIAVNRRGIMLIISSPSGVGKSTITNRIIQSDDNFDMSVSVTTRDRRPNEVDGKDYHFLDFNKFEELMQKDAFIEWAEVHGNFYGTFRSPINKVISQGRDMIFDIDWQGALNIQKQMKSDIVSCFILPPTMRELRSRLNVRTEKNGEDKEKVKLRLLNAYSEIKQWKDYDYVIVNDDLDDTVKILKSIVEVERIRRYRLHNGIDDFIEKLSEENSNIYHT
ncbi:guanylate kinase [Candidatus Liberibacter americanus]|uniref:Guanylate kinase n=1 Tax=Candidatus Liberibacter americanus str. Sao Paulo TaxID=1261131 RepID=U6B8W3_9HYPH|nr:guanylate kinase [Candidatus Liberibacter americanus]AHA28296.1 Guanylate kinase [Candidatus Liberibacter americanus str. Sao Paulo]EMS36588.1 guanylate kinase [Candidatus Liberibacter americanus PW_SP]